MTPLMGQLYLNKPLFKETLWSYELELYMTPIQSQDGKKKYAVALYDMSDELWLDGVQVYEDKMEALDRFNELIKYPPRKRGKG